MIEALIVLVVVGVILFFVTTYIPMPPPFKSAILILGAIFCLIYILQVLGITHFDFHTHAHR